MKNKKNISTLFQETPILLKPSPKAWEKLEQKLNNNKTPKRKMFRFQFHRQLALAASFLAFVIVAGLALFYTINHRQSAHRVTTTPKNQKNTLNLDTNTYSKDTTLIIK
ncbi:MAG: hypothetical protein KBA06_01815 [Saprospiraceae bacterium]|nr:hypothetical protein [Saprospiraceae bacterium]